MLPSARKGVLRNNIDLPRLSIAEPYRYRDNMPIKNNKNDVLVILDPYLIIY